MLLFKATSSALITLAVPLEQWLAILSRKLNWVSVNICSAGLGVDGAAGKLIAYGPLFVGLS